MAVRVFSVFSVTPWCLGCCQCSRFASHELRSGAGKTTFADQLAAALDTTALHQDSSFDDTMFACSGDHVPSANLPGGKPRRKTKSHLPLAPFLIFLAHVPA